MPAAPSAVGSDPLPLVVAPLRRELRPLLRRLGARRLERLPGGALYAARWRERELLAAVIGDGAGRAATSLARLARRADRPIGRMLLLGVAGGLSPDLDVGALVRGAIVVAAAGGDERWRAAAGGDGTVITSPRILVSAADKRDLWHRSGRPERSVVDLESVEFVRTAVGLGVPWTVLRAVSDPQWEGLPLDVARASDAEGHVRGALVLRELARRPAALGRLLVLRRRVTGCASRLAEAALEWIGEDDRHE